MVCMKNILALSVLLFTMTHLSAQDGDGSLLKVGDKAPLFRVETIDGRVIDLAKTKDAVIMLTFFATWCGPCNLELPVLEKNVWNKYRNRKDFVLVVLGREHDKEALVKFAETKNLDLPFAPDVKREAFALYADKNIPRNVIIDKSGTIVWQSIGFDEDEFRKLEDKLAGLLK